MRWPRTGRLVSNPNCSASVVVLPLAAVARAAGLKTVVVDTYQSVSGSGQDALAELEAELADPNAPARVYPRVIAHNVFPQIGPFDSEGLSDEERKVVEELRKMLELPRLAVFTTTVRVPVRVGHSAAVTCECERALSRAELEAAFRAMPGMIYERRRLRDTAGDRRAAGNLREPPAAIARRSALVAILGRGRQSAQGRGLQCGADFNGTLSRLNAAAR